jgi:anthranilate synthase component 1
MFCLQFPEGYALVGSSPEVHVRCLDGRVEIRPIAGTRRRGRTPLEDQMLADELLADPKERAEHIMLVDLARNDVGRVAEFGSIRVSDLMIIERYSHVMHIVSDVEGRLESGRSAYDVMAATFPAGTVSGSPKVRAMQIINELEPTKRNAYAGAVGYFGFDGNLDSCIALRTCVVKNARAYVQAGAGIVADSDPEAEFAETVNKASAILRAIERANAFEAEP